MDFQTSIECPVCREEFNRFAHSPLVLICGHTLCQLCASSVHDTQGRLYCPLDRKTDPRNREEIPVSVQIVELVEYARRMKGKIECLRMSPKGRKVAIRTKLDEERTLCEALIEKLDLKVDSIATVREKAQKEVETAFDVLRTELKQRQGTLEMDLQLTTDQEIAKFEGFISGVRESARTVETGQNPEGEEGEFPDLPSVPKYLTKGKTVVGVLQKFGTITTASVTIPHECDHFRNVTYWMIPPCCSTYYCCNKCHDQRESHIWQYATKMVCMVCCQEQSYRKLPNRCEKCGFDHRSVVSKQGTQYR